MSTSASTSTMTERSGPSAGDTAQHGVQAAKQHAGAAAGAAKEEVASVVSAATDHARSLVGTAGDELREQGRGQTERLSGALREVSEELGRMAEQSDQSTPVARTVRTLADAAGQFARRLEDGGPEGLMSDVAGFARRRPGTFLAVSAFAGFAAGRVVRSTDNESIKQAVRPSHDSGGDSSSASGTDVGATLPAAGADPTAPVRPTGAAASTAPTGTAGTAGTLGGGPR